MDVNAVSENAPHTFQCTMDGCHKSYTQKTNLYRHMRTHKNHNVKPIMICSKPWCNIEFKKKYNLERHEVICKAPNPSKNTCFLCKKKFDTSFNLKRHLIVHANQRKVTAKDKVKLVKKKKVNKEVGTDISAAAGQNRDEIDENETIEENNGPDDIDDNEMMEENNDFPSMVKVDDVNQCDRLKISSAGYQGASVEVGVDCVYAYAKCTEQVNIEDHNDSGEDIDFDLERVGSDISAAAGQNHDEIDENETIEENNEPDDIDDDEIMEENNDEPGDIDVSKNNVSDQVTNDKLDSKLSSAVKYYIRKEIRASRDRVSKKNLTAKFIVKLFESELKEPAFSQWLAIQLRFKTEEDLTTFLKYATATSPLRGQKFSKITSESINQAYKFWKEHAIVSVDRRNNRNMIRIKEAKIPKIVRRMTVEDDETEVITSKCGREKLQGHRYIYCKPVRKLYQMFILKSGVEISFSSFYQCKPFYIGKPTCKEMECCTCITCTNPHFLYQSIRRHAKHIELPESLTSYLTSSFKCSVNPEIGYPDLDCIQGICKNKCHVPAYTSNAADEKKEHTFIKFQSTPEVYFNAGGKQVTYTRCSRNTIKATLKEMVTLLQECSQSYLAHRYFVALDKAFWSAFLASAQCNVLHLDYSENISIAPKNEVQSAHYSSRQYTLHCCVMFEPADIDSTTQKHKFIYHLSDDTNHDAIMTFTVIEDIIEKKPTVISNGNLVIRSDNCSTQYKSKFVFGQMEQISKKYEINIFWFYGAPGHGRGLVDCMSSFGCKAPLKSAIITEDEFFSCAKDMHSYLKNHFKDEDNKMYSWIDQEVTALQRTTAKELRPQIQIHGCSKLHLIAVSPTGEWLKKMILTPSDSKIMNLEMDIEDATLDELIDDGLENEENEDTLTADMIRGGDLKFESITENSFITLLSSSSGFEQFYLIKVLEKGVAEKLLIDKHGHNIEAGHRYILGSYYEKTNEKQHSVYYKQSKKFHNVLIHIDEVCSVGVDFDGTAMSKEEYISILTNIFC
jgi:hypothetical protein